jgi:hypothetical protein
MLGDCVPKKFISLLRAISTKGFSVREFIDSPMHRFDSGGGKWFGDIPDSATNNILGKARFLFAELSYPASNFWE